jgi:DNA invertase Pin-like site-specific DNA recombinase
MREITTTTGQTQSTRRRRPRFGGYLRVSDVGDRGDALRSPELQTEVVERSAAAEGVEVRWYDADLDVSGSKSSRANLDAILEAIERGELDGIYVARLNRFSRLPARERIELVDRVNAAGGAIYSGSEPNDLSTPEGRFVRELFYSLARMEWERYADGFTHAKRNALAKGVAILNVAPLGYDFDADHRLVVGELAPLVAELFERRARDDAGSSYGALADWLADELGRPVPAPSVKRWLTNRTYLGELRNAGELSPIRHEAIVGVELWDAVQAVNDKRTTGRGVAVGRAKELLAGIATCAGCGGPLFKHHGNGKGAYVCGDRKCRAKGRAIVAELDAFVTAKVIEWAGPAADELVELELELGTRGDRIIAEDRLAKAQAAAIAYEQNVELELSIGDAAYAAGRQARAEAIERCQADLAACGDADELEVVRSTLREALTSGELDVAERRRLFAIAIASVVVRRPASHGAPVADRAVVTFRDDREPASSSFEQDRSELVEQLPA